MIDQENYCGRFLLSRPFLTQYLHEVIVELLLIMGFLKPDRDFVIVVEFKPIHVIRLNVHRITSSLSVNI